MSDTPRTDAAINQQHHRYNAVKQDGWSFARTLERENAAQKTALTKASTSLSAFLGFHAEALPLEAVRGLSELVREIQPLIKDTISLALSHQLRNGQRPPTCRVRK